MNWKRKTDLEVLKTLGARVKARRIQNRLTQEELAQKAGVTKYTVQKLEYGQPTNMKTFVQVLRALGVLDQLDLFLPQILQSPLSLLKNREKAVQRVKKPKV